MLYKGHQLDSPAVGKIFKDVREELFPGIWSCRNYRMLQFFHNRNVQACMIYAITKDNFYKILDLCDNKDLDVILNHKIAPNNSEGHCTVYLGRDDQGIHISDPNMEKQSHRYSFDEYETLATKSLSFDEIVESYSMLIVNLTNTPQGMVTISYEDNAQNISEQVQIFDFLKDYNVQTLLPISDRRIEVN